MARTTKVDLKILSEQLMSKSDSELQDFLKIIEGERGHDMPYVPYTKKEIMSEIKRRKMVIK